MMRKIVATLAALGTVAVIGVVTRPGIASATVHCYASTCQGQDPQKMGCSSDAVTLETVTLPTSYSNGAYNGTIELRYSRACWAEWARLTSYADYQEARAEGATCVASFCHPIIFYGGWESNGSGPNYPPAVDWTVMISFDYWVRACGYWIPGQYDEICTGYH